MPCTEIDYKRTAQLYPKQKAFINSKKQYVFCLGSNKCGKTDLLCIKVLEKSLEFKEGQVICWLAPVSSQAKIAFDSCILHLKKTNILNIYKENKSLMTLTSPTGAKIRFVGSEKSSSVWGYSHHFCVVDEASHVKDESWNALVTTVYHTKGQIFCIGNPTNRYTWFYKAWDKAKKGEYEDGEAYKLTSMDAVKAGVLDRNFIEKERKRLSKANFQRNILAEVPSEDDTNPFGYKALELCCRDYTVEEMKNKGVYCYGIDLAKSVDWTVICGLNKKGVLVYFDRFQNSWELTKKKILAVVKKTPTLVDSTGVGDPILESLQTTNPNILGYKYNNISKVHLVEKLAIAIQQGEITLPLDNEILLGELESFETQQTPKDKKITYNAATGYNDDCVNALALAVMQLDKGIVPLDSFYKEDKEEESLEGWY